MIEQNSSVMDTRHWYGTIDSSEAKKKGIAPVDRAELLSEISRSMGGRCDQRVVKTWINESAAMHDFVSGILENEPYNYVCNLTSGDEAKWPDDTQVSQSKLMFPVQQVDYSSAEKPRNVVFQEYIESKGYSIDFNTSLAKLEKDADGRITGVIAQSTADDHFIRINAAKGVLLACGGYAGNPYMMEQLDPLGTSVTTACSYTPADKGYGIRAAIWQVHIWMQSPLPFCSTVVWWPPVWMPAMWTARTPLAARLSPALWSVQPRQPALPEGQPPWRTLYE